MCIKVQNSSTAFWDVTLFQSNCFQNPDKINLDSTRILKIIPKVDKIIENLWDVKRLDKFYEENQPPNVQQIEYLETF